MLGQDTREDRTRPAGVDGGRRLVQRERPVVLATLSVPLDPRAINFALQCVAEDGHPLIIAGFIGVTPGPGLMLPVPQLDAALQPAIDAVSPLPIRVRVLKVRSPHPLPAMVEVIDDVDAALLAFGPDPDKIRPRAYRRAARFLSDRAPCLLWLATDATVSA